MIAGIVAGGEPLASSGGGGGATFKHWRVDIAASSSNGFDHTVGDIELRATSGGTNLAVSLGGTASASSADYPASRAFDGLINRNTNSWVGTGARTQWVAFEFAVAQSIAECVLINSSTVSGAELAQHVRNYLVSYSSDGTTWTPSGRKFGASNATSASSTVALSSSFGYSGYSRYRLYITAINGGSNCALASLELIDSDAYDVATGLSSNATASTSYGGEPPARAFDGSASTTWTTDDGASAPHWIAINLVIRAQLQSFAITNQNGLGNRMPKDFVLQGSNDGSTWTDVKSVTNETAWANLERRVFTI